MEQRRCRSLVGLVVWLTLASAAWGQAPPAASSGEAVLAYREAANFQNNGAFDIAVEEWQKFLKAHGQDPLAAKAQHYLGVCQLQLKQYGPASESFAKVVKNHPQFEFLEDAYFNLASSQYALAAGGQPAMYASAAASFGTLLTKYPAGKYAEEALFYQGESLYAEGKKAEAATAYQRLVTDFPKSKRRADALYALGFAQEELNRPKQAAQTYDLYLQEFANSSLASEVKLRRAEALLQSDDVLGAERLFGQVALIQGFDAADQALARQAFCLAKLEKLPEAGAAYARLATHFASSTYAADAALSAGRCYYRANDANEARQWLGRAVARHDANSTEAAHWLCRLLIKAGQPGEAAQIAAAELPRAAGPFAPHLELDQADALYEIADQRAQALDLYTRFASNRPQHELAPQAQYSAAFAALELKQYAAGLASAIAFLRTHPQHELAADVKQVAAECSLQLKDYPAAGNYFRQLTSEHASRPEAEAWRVRLGLVAYLQKDYDAALAALRPLAGQFKSADARAEAQFIIGASQFHLGQFAAASKSLAAGLEASQSGRQADESLLYLSRAQAKENKAEAAIASLRRLVSEHPHSQLLDEAHFRLGELLEAAGDGKGARDEYALVAKDFPNSQFSPYALYSQGWAQSKSKDFVSAAAAFTALLTRFPDHKLAPDALYGRALCRRQAGDAAGAIADLDAYLKTNPERARASDALFERGMVQFSTRDNAGAIATLDGLLQADPQYAKADRVLYEVGWALKTAEKHAEAVTYFAQLAEQHPTSGSAAEAWFHVGEDRYDNKQYDEAARAYANCRAKNPAGELGEKAAYKLGWTQFQRKDFASAQQQFAEQLAAFPKGPLAADAAFMKAECLFRQEKYQDAWPAYQAALQLPAANPTMEAMEHLHAAQTAAQLKEWNQAVSLLERLRAKQPQSPLLAEVHYELGWARQNLEQTEAALADYEVAATNSQDHVGARARFMRGELLFAQKKHAEASREFRRVMLGYGGEQATAETRNWQAKSAFEAGRCAEILLGAASDAATRERQLDDATRCYKFITEKNPGHELAAEANKRLSALKKP